MFDLIELVTHWHAGRSQRQLAESLGIDRKTIAKYLWFENYDEHEFKGRPFQFSQWTRIESTPVIRTCE